MKNHITQFCLSILCAWTMGSIIACMPAISDPRVMHVASSDGIAYAALEPGKYGFNSTVSYAQSEDGGKTWSPTTNVPPGIFQDKIQPSVLCDPNRSSLCFRIPQKSQVDESNDGGKTWRVGWRIAPGREDYMLGMTCKIFGCARTGDWGPYDLYTVRTHRHFRANRILLCLASALGEDGRHARVGSAALGNASHFVRSCRRCSCILDSGGGGAFWISRSHLFRSTFTQMWCRTCSGDRVCLDVEAFGDSHNSTDEGEIDRMWRIRGAFDFPHGLVAIAPLGVGDYSPL
jgi:hypothetical protein